MKFEDIIKKHFADKADDLLKDFPDEDPDFSKMSIDELKLYTQESN